LNSSALSGIFFKQAHTKVAGLEGDLQGQFLEKTVWGFQQETPAGARSGRPPGSRVRKTLLPRVIELLREADNPKFDQKSPVNAYKK